MQQVEQRGLGRPRNAEHDRKIMSAVFAELASKPYSKMSVDDVARRAGVAKTTLYRRYPTKLDLVTAAVDRYFATRFFTLAEGTISDVIADAIEQQVHEFGSTDAGRAMANLASEALGDPALFALLQLGDKRGELRRALERGVERGELRVDANLDVIIDVLVALFPYRLIVLQQPIPADLARSLTELVLHGAAPRGQS